MSDVLHSGGINKQIMIIKQKNIVEFMANNKDSIVELMANNKDRLYLIIRWVRPCDILVLHDYQGTLLVDPCVLCALEMRKDTLKLLNY